jgi:hypothetical protein
MAITERDAGLVTTTVLAIRSPADDANTLCFDGRMLAAVHARLKHRTAISAKCVSFGYGELASPAGKFRLS